ncbi:MAG: ATP-dependent RNA helicase [Paludibacter sp. 47-17]|nr:MAG: ATP-dependent RNA helicase [Paludibacter sp. SCN 51-9]OJX90308.1 MAG: ATP-dependent RNA helicase [Paludibacter sp. 47-17]
MRFDELPLCEPVLAGLDAMNFTDATPVQEQTIPVILEKKDVIACAQTGTGKTAAFILPLLHNLQSEPHADDKINAIIMAPTRELAQQIDQQMEGFSYFTPFSSVAVYGGNDAAAWDVQRKGLQKGADVVIATPGRLLSHINLYDIDFSQVKYFILDEADRMLDMGFFDDIMTVVKRLPADRQTIMFSATMPPKIRTLAKTILKDPVEVKIAVSRPPETIRQMAYICNETQKQGIIRHLFAGKEVNKVIIFSGSKLKVKELFKSFRQMKLSVGEMHSDLEQAQRDHVMHEFRNSRISILVATDIVARGIDIDDISMVINYDVPHDEEDYVHRIGRTARAGESGMAITFVSEEEQYKFHKIEEFLEKDIEKLILPEGLGEAPEYNPQAHRFGHKKFASRKGAMKRKKTRQPKNGPAAVADKPATLARPVKASSPTEQPGTNNPPRKKRKKRRSKGNKPETPSTPQ